jgi:serine/threonine-protein kinase
MIIAIISVALVVLVAGGFLIFELAGALFTGPTAQPTATPIPNVTVPNLVGKTCADATQYMTQQKLNLTVNCQPVATGAPKNTPQGQIFKQDPVAGASAKAGTAVNVDVYSGPNTTLVPNVVNEDFGTACADIQKANLICQNSNNPVYSQYPVGNVVSTNPPAGQQVQEGSTVLLTTSLGPQPTATSPAPTATSPAPTATPCNTPVPTGPPTCN